MTDRLLELIPRPIASMKCAGCDGTMVLRKDAIGREYLRCPKCNPLAPDRRRHPDDAMIPQGLVKANVPVRVVREFVKVAEPSPDPIYVPVLPEIRFGQLRCQLCSEGIEASCRFCSACAKRGHEIVDARRTRLDEREPGQRYAKKPCERCTTVFQPTGPASKFCNGCRTR